MRAMVSPRSVSTIRAVSVDSTVTSDLTRSIRAAAIAGTNGLCLGNGVWTSGRVSRSEAAWSRQSGAFECAETHWTLCPFVTLE